MDGERTEAGGLEGRRLLRQHPQDESQRRGKEERERVFEKVGLKRSEISWKTVTYTLQKPCQDPHEAPHVVVEP